MSVSFRPACSLGGRRSGIGRTTLLPRLRLDSRTHPRRMLVRRTKMTTHFWPGAVAAASYSRDLRPPSIAVPDDTVRRSLVSQPALSYMHDVIRKHSEGVVETAGLDLRVRLDFRTGCQWRRRSSQLDNLRAVFGGQRRRIVGDEGLSGTPCFGTHATVMHQLYSRDRSRPYTLPPTPFGPPASSLRGIQALAERYFFGCIKVCTR
uniref:Uncharacterized protein n=1 Tax=Mycena chlorophos TaxID=658473 RepID=A0ABQ0M2J0_MYCCL|nr:predicted protein [Mycena chlorophos]